MHLIPGWGEKIPQTSGPKSQNRKQKQYCNKLHKDFKNGLHQKWRRKWQPTPVFLPGASHGQRSLVGYCSWGHKESDMTEWLCILKKKPLQINKNYNKWRTSNLWPTPKCQYEDYASQAGDRRFFWRFRSIWETAPRNKSQQNSYHAIQSSYCEAQDSTKILFMHKEFSDPISI